MKKRQQGVLTVEASIVLSTIILFILFLFSFARVYSAQSLVSHAVLQSSDAVALESYLREETLNGSEADVVKLANLLKQTDSISAESFTSLRSADIPKIARQKFVLAIAQTEEEADAKLKQLGVIGGLDGVDFSGSKMDLGKDDVIVSAKYSVKMQFSVFGNGEVEFTKSARSKTFGDILFSIVTLPDDENKGSASGGGNYKYGTQVQISATPNYGYRFVKWADGNTQNPRTVTVTGPKTYTAIFEEDDFGVTLFVAEKGSANKYQDEAEYGKVEKSGLYKYNQTVSITATPKSGYKFKEWVVDAHKDGTTKAYTTKQNSLKINQSYTATAYFEKENYKVKVEASGVDNGNANIIYNNKIYSEKTLPYKEAFKLSAANLENSGYKFLGWKIKGTDSYFTTELSYLMTVPASNVTYVAVYKAKPSIKITGGATGSNVTTLSVTRNPASGGTVTWSSSDTSKAKVNSSGKVTAVGNGKVVITATLNYDGFVCSDSVTIGLGIDKIKLEEYNYKTLSGVRHYFDSEVMPGSRMPQYSENIGYSGKREAGALTGTNKYNYVSYSKSYFYYRYIWVTEAQLNSATKVSSGGNSPTNQNQWGYNKSNKTGYLFNPHKTQKGFIFFETNEKTYKITSIK